MMYHSIIVECDLISTTQIEGFENSPNVCSPDFCGRISRSVREHNYSLGHKLIPFQKLA